MKTFPLPLPSPTSLCTVVYHERTTLRALQNYHGALIYEVGPHINPRDMHDFFVITFIAGSAVITIADHGPDFRMLTQSLDEKRIPYQEMMIPVFSKYCITTVHFYASYENSELFREEEEKLWSSASPEIFTKISNKPVWIAAPFDGFKSARFICYGITLSDLRDSISRNENDLKRYT